MQRRKGRHGVFAGKTVWSMPERFAYCIVKRRYINTRPFLFPFLYRNLWPEFFYAGDAGPRMCTAMLIRLILLLCNEVQTSESWRLALEVDVHSMVSYAVLSGSRRTFLHWWWCWRFLGWLILPMGGLPIIDRSRSRLTLILTPLTTYRYLVPHFIPSQFS